MADEKLLHELAALANGDVDMKVYAGGIVDVLRQSLQKTYISKISSLLEEYKIKTKSEMQKEVQLLEAVKPFISENDRQQFDMITDMFNNIHAIKYLLNDLSRMKGNISLENDRTNNFRTKNEDLVIREDGFCEIDDRGEKLESNSSNAINPSMLLWLLLSKM